MIDKVTKGARRTESFVIPRRRSTQSVAAPPFLRREAERQLPEITEAVERVVRSGRFLFGDELLGLERELAASLDVPCAVGVGTGTDAIHLALRALDVGAGDEVITQSHSASFTVIAICEAGARPVLVDSRLRSSTSFQPHSSGGPPWPSWATLVLASAARVNPERTVLVTECMADLLPATCRVEVDMPPARPRFEKRVRMRASCMVCGSAVTGKNAGADFGSQSLR